MKEFSVVKTTVINVRAEEPAQAIAKARLVNEKEDIIIPGTSVKKVNYDVLSVLNSRDANNKKF